MKKKQRFLCVRFFDLMARGWGGIVVVKALEVKK